MRTTIAAIILGLLAGACSGSGAAPAPWRAPVGGSPADASATPATATGPTAGECAQLATYVQKLAARERGDRPPAQRPIEADHEAVRARLASFTDECRAQPRDAHACAMAATTLDALAACQPTRSSSTSNSSVAPGGITPPAP